jgi:acetolactate synthase small subunit
LMLVKLKPSAKSTEAVALLVSKYRMLVVEQNDQVMIVECTETRDNTKKIFEALKELGILEIAQTGAVALSKKAPKD